VDAGKVTLGVKIDQQRRPFGATQGSPEIEGCRRFADAALLVEYGDAHGSVFYTRCYFSLNIQVSATNSATRR
jgi:hypothetical protein